MKTAISIPDAVFRAAERAARRLKLSRSELYSVAVASYVERHAARGVTETLDAVYADAEASRLDPALAAAQAHILGRERW
jgi:metal-responsive CopG/Arc/MetJ family transcriptional regulator